MAEEKDDTQLIQCDEFPHFIQETEHFLVSKLTTPSAIHKQVADLVSGVEYKDLHHVQLSVAVPKLHPNVKENINRVQNQWFKATIQDAYNYYLDNPIEWQLVEFGLFTSTYAISKRSGQKYSVRGHDYLLFQYVFGMPSLADV